MRHNDLYNELYRYVCYPTSERGIGAPDDNGLAQQKSELSYRTGPQIFLSETVSNSLPIRLPKPKTVFLYITRMIMYHIFTHFLAAQICSRSVLCFEKCQSRRGLLVLLAHFGFATSCSLLGFSLSCVCIGDCVESGASLLFPVPTQSHKLET